jgi:hypothetical protein
MCPATFCMTECLGFHTVPNVKQSTCPSCGAPLTFENAHSLYAVCKYCKTMSVQSEDALKEVGKTAALVEDGSPLQLGASGTIDGKTFTIIGRIQYSFGLGYWNEWFLNMAEDAGGPAWLGEANGMYFFTRHKKDAKLPDTLDFSKLVAGGSVSVDGKEFFIKDIQKTKVVSGEGELPFPFESEYEAPVVDMLRQDGTFATLDFSEDKPLVFIGKAMTFRDLHLARLRSVYGFKTADA